MKKPVSEPVNPVPSFPAPLPQANISTTISAGSPPVPQQLPAALGQPVQPVNPPAPVPAPAPEPKKPVALEERFVVGEEYERTIANLMEMGFSRDQVIKALKAAFNNPERATEYLLNVENTILYNN